MTVFAIIASSNTAAMGAAVVGQYGANHYRFADNVWFISDSGTTRSVATKLNIPDGKLGADGVVVAIPAYSGYAASTAWKWLQQYPEAIPSG